MVARRKFYQSELERITDHLRQLRVPEACIEKHLQDLQAVTALRARRQIEKRLADEAHYKREPVYYYSYPIAAAACPELGTRWPVEA
jgi:hypothetical protein